MLIEIEKVMRFALDDKERKTLEEAAKIFEDIADEADKQMIFDIEYDYRKGADIEWFKGIARDIRLLKGIHLGEDDDE